MKDITNKSWKKLWYLNVVFGIWLTVGLIIIMGHSFGIGQIQESVSAHYLVGIPGYALAAEMTSIVGFKGAKAIKQVIIDKKGGK